MKQKVYKYREVECPYCNHVFMWINGESIPNKTIEYRIEGCDAILEDAICPECGRTCLIMPGILAGLREDDSRVRKFGIRGL